jgi:hypothetical protein
MTDTYDLTNPVKPTITKDPDATLDYTFDWTDWLDDIYDNIAPPPVLTVTENLVVVSISRNGSRGTGKNYKTDAAGYTVGSTAINVSGGSGTITSADLVKFDNDSKLYQVASFGAGVLTLVAPGLIAAIPASAVRVTVRAAVIVVLSGGNIGKTASCNCLINTVGPPSRIDDRTIYLKIKER